MIADIAFAAVGMEQDLRSLQDQQQLRFVFVQPGQQQGQRGVARLLSEDCIEAFFQFVLEFFRRSRFLGFQVGVEIPNLAATARDFNPVLVIERQHLVNEAFCVDPA
jgi:hypothetical protein